MVKLFYYYFVQASMMERNSAPPLAQLMLPTTLITGPQLYTGRELNLESVLIVYELISIVI